MTCWQEVPGCPRCLLFLRYCSLFSLMASSICAGKSVIGIQIAIVLALISHIRRRSKESTYLHMVAVPLSFLMLSGLALLWEYNPSDKGILVFSSESDICA